MKVIKNTRRNQRGAALVEYGLIVAGVALVAAAAVSVFGHKTASMMAASAAILPGAQAADNGPIAAGQIVDTSTQGGSITINPLSGNHNLGDNLGLQPGQIDSLTTNPAGN
jgi:pilus assembly protein Flp/PilA